jgi:NAD(P)H-dependent flavin oxidoreductase YrpB (nitropropane dioxygenase family)
MQAPIGRAATPSLVAAVCQAGGLGTLAASWTELDELRGELATIRALTQEPFAVNLVLAFEQEDRLALLLEDGVPVITFSWGVEPDLVGRASEAGSIVGVQVGNLEAGLRAVEAGAAFLIGQGVEAGGHVEDSRPLVELVRDLHDEVEVPVAAAGGIVGEQAVAAAFAAGASAIACGTAFLAALEADVHPVYRERIFRATGADTTLTTAFDVGWPEAPHRVLRNETVADWERAGTPMPGSRPGEGEVVAFRDGVPIPRYSDAMPTTRTQGDVGEMALYGGAGVEHVVQLESAAAITRRLAGFAALAAR